MPKISVGKDKVTGEPKIYEVSSGNLNDAVDKAVEMARNDPQNTIEDSIHRVKERIQAAGGSIGYVDPVTGESSRSASDLRNIDAQIKAAQKQQTQMTEAKHSLMSEQLTGKTRQELIDLSEAGDIEGLKDKVRQVETATAPTTSAVETERARIEAQQKAIEAQRIADEEAAKKKYDPANLTDEMRDRLLTWADDPANPTVGWATMAEKLNINPQAVIEAKRQLKETISKIPGAGQTVEGILSGAIWNNPIVTDVIRQMVDSPQGRRWEGDVGVVYSYLAGRELGVGKQQADSSMSTFRSEGHGITGGPGRHPTNNYTAFDDFEMAKEAGLVSGAGANIARPPTPAQMGDWNLTQEQVDEMYPWRSGYDASWTDPSVTVAGAGDTPPTGAGDTPLPEVGGGGTEMTPLYPAGGAGTRNIGAGILNASDPSNFNLPHFTGTQMTPLYSGSTSSVMQQVMAPVQQVTGQGGTNMAGPWGDYPSPMEFGLDHQGLYPDDPSPGSPNLGRGFGVGGSPWIDPYGESPQDWLDFFRGALRNKFGGRGITGADTLEAMYQPLSQQYLLGSYLAPRDRTSNRFSDVPGIGMDTRWQDYINSMMGGGGGMGGFAQGFNPQLMSRHDPVGLQNLLRQAAEVINRPVTTGADNQGFTLREAGLRDYLNNPDYGRGRQMQLASGASLGNVPNWIRGYAMQGAQDLMNARMAQTSGTTQNINQVSPLQGFVDRGFKF